MIPIHDDLTFTLVSQSVAKIAESNGFTHVENRALHILTAKVMDLMKTISMKARMLGNGSSIDILHILRSAKLMHIDKTALDQFLIWTLPIPPVVQVPRYPFPVRREPVRYHLSEEELKRREIMGLPSFLPPLKCEPEVIEEIDEQKTLVEPPKALTCTLKPSSKLTDNLKDRNCFSVDFLKPVIPSKVSPSLVLPSVERVTESNGNGRFRPPITFTIPYFKQDPGGDLPAANTSISSTSTSSSTEYLSKKKHKHHKEKNREHKHHREHNHDDNRHKDEKREKKKKKKEKEKEKERKANQIKSPEVPNQSTHLPIQPIHLPSQPIHVPSQSTDLLSKSTDIQDIKPFPKPLRRSKEHEREKVNETPPKVVADPKLTLPTRPAESTPLAPPKVTPEKLVPKPEPAVVQVTPSPAVLPQEDIKPFPTIKFKPMLAQNPVPAAVDERQHKRKHHDDSIPDEQTPKKKHKQDKKSKHADETPAEREERRRLKKERKKEKERRSIKEEVGVSVAPSDVPTTPVLSVSQTVIHPIKLKISLGGRKPNITLTKSEAVPVPVPSNPRVTISTPLPRPAMPPTIPTPIPIPRMTTSSDSSRPPPAPASHPPLSFTSPPLPRASHSASPAFKPRSAGRPPGSRNADKTVKFPHVPKPSSKTPMIMSERVQINKAMKESMKESMRSSESESPKKQRRRRHFDHPGRAAMPLPTVVDPVDPLNPSEASLIGVTPVTVSADPIDTDEKWDCPICKKKYQDNEEADNMVCCENCHYWYHWNCVGLVAEPPEEVDWYCTPCKLKLQRI